MKSLVILTLITLFCASPQADKRKPADAETLDEAASVQLKKINNDDALLDGSSTIPKPPLHSKDSGTDEMSVKTWKYKIDSIQTKPIQLVSPPHKSIFTPGVIEFSWKVNTNEKSAKKIKNKKTKIQVVIQEIDSNKKFVHTAKGESRQLSVGPGTYRWQVVSKDLQIESRWRYFKVIKFKSNAITQLYEGNSPPQPAKDTRSPTSTKKQKTKPKPTKIDRSERFDFKTPKRSLKLTPFEQ